MASGTRHAQFSSSTTISGTSKMPRFLELIVCKEWFSRPKRVADHASGEGSELGLLFLLISVSHECILKEICVVEKNDYSDASRKCGKSCETLDPQC